MVRLTYIFIFIALLLIVLFMAIKEFDWNLRQFSGTFAFHSPNFIVQSNSPIVTQLQNKNLTEKWIVITTVDYPTAAVKALATENGWRVVVVADMKTPSDWNETNCDFLSIEAQNELSFSINGHVPFNSYTRKMVGYLYAIQNGAKWIYDTDDDKQPVGLGLKQFEMDSKSSGMSYGFLSDTESRKRNLFNPYEFWGQPSIWPRGYPLENVKHLNIESAFRLCKSSKTSVIQQGLLMKDPDVDAIYRLLHANVTDGLDVSFNQHAPPITLNSGTYCPFNSRNTLFHRDAFWSLFLPVSVTIRVTDIWRGYYAQKLLHLTGQRLGFYPANAIQKRNSHSYVADFKDEESLYSDAGRMTDFLTTWTCNFNTLPECMLQLSSDFVVQSFWKKADLDLTEAWITDLRSLNYSFPRITRHNSNAAESSTTKQYDDCRGAVLRFSAEKNGEIANKMQEYHTELKDWCNEVLPAKTSFAHRFDKTKNFSAGIWTKLEKIALIIANNFPLTQSVSLMQRLYEPYFASVIFCGTNYEKNFRHNDTSYPKMITFSYINVTESELDRGNRFYICTLKAIELKLQSIDGYITIGDDTAYNFYNVFDFSRFRLSGIFENLSYWWESQWGMVAMNKSIEILRNETMLRPQSKLSKVLDVYSKVINGSVYALLGERDVLSNCDFYYLPTENETFFYELGSVFYEANLFLEIALPKIGAGLEWLNYYSDPSITDITTHIHIWGQDRNVWEKFYSKNITSLHPVKLSFVRDFKERSKYCDLIIRNLLDSISVVSQTTVIATMPTTQFTTPSTVALQ